MAYQCKSLSLIGTAPEGGVATFPLYCRRWDCKDCGPRQRKRLKIRLMRGNPNSFLTFTTNPAFFHMEKDAYYGLSLALNRLFKRLRRIYGRPNVEYAVVWEVTKKGWPHAHILLRAPWIPKRLISRIWAELTGAKVVDIRSVKSAGQASSYITKYLTKNPQVPFGCKRFRTSYLYSSPLAKGGLKDILNIDKWERFRRPLPDAVDYLTSLGYSPWQWLPELYVGHITGPPTASSYNLHDQLSSKSPASN